MEVAKLRTDLEKTMEGADGCKSPTKKVRGRFGTINPSDPGFRAQGLHGSIPMCDEFMSMDPNTRKCRRRTKLLCREVTCPKPTC